MNPIARSAALAVGLLVAAGLAGAEDRSKCTECTHQMTGTVKDLDGARGTLEIQIAGEEPLRIHLPASEISGFEEGDEVIVSMGVEERPPATRPVR